MIAAFAQHLIERYGLAEVSTWRLRSLERAQPRLLGRSAQHADLLRALRSHRRSPSRRSRQRLQRRRTLHRARPAFVAEFLAHCKSKNIPVDFASTRTSTATTTARQIVGSDTQRKHPPRQHGLPSRASKVHDEVAGLGLSRRFPLIFSEYNASYANEPDVTDTVYMGPWLANNIRLCDGLTEQMAYWSFSDVFEEQGVVKTHPSTAASASSPRTRHPQTRLQRLPACSTSSAISRVHARLRA